MVDATGSATRGPRRERREIDARDVARVHKLAERAANYRIARRLPGYPVASRQRLHARAGRRLTPTEEWVLAILRKVERCRYPALHCSVEELGLLTGRCERSVQNALTGLGQHDSSCEPGCRRHVDMVRRIPVFDSVAWCDAATRRTYQRRQRANVYMLTANAPHPGRVRRPHAAGERWPRGPRAQDLGSVPARRRGARTSRRDRSFERKNLHPYSFPFLRKEKGWSGRRDGAPAPSPDLARAAPAADPRSPGGGAGFAGERSGGLEAASIDAIADRLGLTAISTLVSAIVSRESARSSGDVANASLAPPEADQEGGGRPALSLEWRAELERLHSALDAGSVLAGMLGDVLTDDDQEPEP